MRRRALLAAAGFFCAAALAADGGRLRASEESGPFRVSVYTRPDPVGAGPAEVSVLVQDRATGQAVLDAEAILAVTGPDGVERTVPVRRDARNRLFVSAEVGFPAGRSAVEVRVRRGGGQSRIGFEVEALAGAGRRTAMETIWPYLALPPVAVALFAANRMLRRRQRLARVTA